MVLSASTADHRAGAPGAWLKHLGRVLHLGRDKVIVLVTGAVPARLRELVQHLLQVDSGARVHATAGALTGAPEGALALLAARGEDAGWLNMQRPIFAERRMRLVVWADDATTVALSERAPDFFDWISHVVTCPSQPRDRVPGFAVAGLRGAPGYPGVVWTGGDLDTALAVALPGSEVVRASARGSYDALVAAAQDAGERWLVWTDVETSRDLVRVRWTLAEADRRARTVLERPACAAPGWWPVTDQSMDVHEAVARLGDRADGDAALLAALLDLEPGAVALAAALQMGDAPALLTRMRHAADPGAELARDALARVVVEVDSIDTPGQAEARAPILRASYHEASVEARREDTRARTARWLETWSVRQDMPASDGPAMAAIIEWANGCPAAPPPLPATRSRWNSYWIEALLRTGADPEMWLRIIQWALDHGYRDAAELWLHREAPDNREPTALSPAMQDLDGRGLYLLGQMLEEHGRDVLAMQCLERSWALTSATKDGRGHGYAAAVLAEVAQVLREQGALGDIEPLVRKTLESIQAHQGAEPRAYVELLHLLALTLVPQGRYQEAEELYRQIWELTEQTMGSEHPALAALAGNLAELCLATGRAAEAAEHAARGHELAMRSRGPEHPETKGLEELRQHIAQVLAPPLPNISPEPAI